MLHKLLVVVFVICSVGGASSYPDSLTPNATLDISQLSPPSANGEINWRTVRFISPDTIAVAVCRTGGAPKCVLSVVKWENGTLRRVAQTLTFVPETSIHSGGGGRILALKTGSPSVLYSDDLSTNTPLSETVSLVSTSGSVVGHTAKDSWKIFKLGDNVQLVREGSGSLQTLSDTLAIVKTGNTLTTETFQGRKLGTLSVSSKVNDYVRIGIVDGDRLYLDDCREVRIVGFSGKLKSSIHSGKGCSKDDTSVSADGKRILVDFVVQKTSKTQGALEKLRAITTLGMSGSEGADLEAVQVFDTATGTKCFDWSRQFPMSYGQVRSAAIAPAGDFAAIVSDTNLSIYRIPEICNIATHEPKK